MRGVWNSPVQSISRRAKAQVSGDLVRGTCWEVILQPDIVHAVDPPTRIRDHRLGARSCCRCMRSRRPASAA